jgi:diguanylate cyclase (GGDEF)-like protein
MQPAISNDIMADASLAPLHDDFRALGLRSQGCFPLLVDQRAIGVMTLCSVELDAFDDDEVRLLLELAGDIAFAFDHIRKDERLNHLAYYDALTGLANASLLNERLAQTIVSAGDEQLMLALALIDVERFKTINDTFGRHCGDALLTQIAGRLSEGPDTRTPVARIGADHFAIVIPDARDEASVARLLTEQYRRCFVPPFQVGGHELRIAAKIGIALYPNDGRDAEALHRNAEAALNKAKLSSERVLFYDPRMTEAVAEKLALENKLRLALERREFVLHYQPKVDVDSRCIEGVEALIRWNAPGIGLVPPLKFIPLLEETGLIVDVGLWALRRAALDHRAWRDQGLAAPRIAVNVSAVQLRRPDFVATVEALLKQHAGQPHGIDIELTESLIMEDIEANIASLHALRALGMQLAIDDFGTGYSSLAYLAKLPAQALKIDRTFIMTMLDEPDNMTLVSTMISLAHSLRMKVIAEGVETEEQAKMLRLLRCDQIQGYLVSRPVSFEQMSELIRQQPPRSAGA